MVNDVLQRTKWGTETLDLSKGNTGIIMQHGTSCSNFSIKQWINIGSLLRRKIIRALTATMVSLLIMTNNKKMTYVSITIIHFFAELYWIRANVRESVAVEQNIMLAHVVVFNIVSILLTLQLRGRWHTTAEQARNRYTP